MKVIITGASGMVGKGVLLECLDHPEITHVLTIGRSQVGMTHAKLRELVHTGFLNFSAIKTELTGFDACYFCMGVSAAGLNEEQYHRLTYDYTLSLAKILVQQNQQMVCTYVSGQGTDTSEKGNSMWGRVKGKTENALLNLGFKKAYMFRPGAILPLRGIKSKTKSYQFFYNYFTWLLKIMKTISPKSIVNTTQIGKAMINVTKYGYEKTIIAPGDIHVLAAM